MHLFSAPLSVYPSNRWPSQCSLVLIGRNADLCHQGYEDPSPQEAPPQPEPLRRASFSAKPQVATNTQRERPAHHRHRSLSLPSPQRHKDGTNISTSRADSSPKIYKSLQTIFRRTAAMVSKPIKYLFHGKRSDLCSLDSETAILLRNHGPYITEMDLNPFGNPWQAPTFPSAKPKLVRTRTWHGFTPSPPRDAEQSERSEMTQRTSVETWRPYRDDAPWDEDRNVW